MKISPNKSVFKKSISIVLGFVFILLMIFTSIGNSNVKAVESEEQKQSKSKIMVSMGDSYSSGEGVPEFYDQNLTLKEKVKSMDWLAHRSKKAWSGQLILPSVGKMSDNRNKNWFFVAASGAETKHINGEFKIGRASCRERVYRAV